MGPGSPLGPFVPTASARRRQCTHHSTSHRKGRTEDGGSVPTAQPFGRSHHVAALTLTLTSPDGPDGMPCRLFLCLQSSRSRTPSAVCRLLLRAARKPTGRWGCDARQGRATAGRAGRVERLASKPTPTPKQGAETVWTSSVGLPPRPTAPLRHGVQQRRKARLFFASASASGAGD